MTLSDIVRAYIERRVRNKFREYGLLIKKETWD